MTNTTERRQIRLDSQTGLVDDRGFPAPINVAAWRRVTVQAIERTNNLLSTGAFKLQATLGGVRQDLSTTATFDSSAMFRRGIDVRDDSQLDAIVTSLNSGAVLDVHFFLHDLPD